MKSLIYCVLGLVCMFGFGSCGNFTVTDEAWFEVEIKDFEGPDQNYRGSFTVALFGESAPMTVLNFASIAKGYKKKGKVQY